MSEESLPVLGEEIHRWARDLFPICCSVTGDGVRETLRYFQKILPDLTLHEVPSGTQAFDWTVPDEWNIMPSRDGDSPADRVARHVLGQRAGAFDEYDFLQRGGDERQHCSPGVDLPVAVVMRSTYGTYPKYHTSADDLSLVTPAGLAGGFVVLRDCLRVLEHDGFHRGPRHDERAGLCDGRRDLVALAELVRLSALDVIPMLETLMQHGLVERLAAAADGG